MAAVFGNFAEDAFDPFAAGPPPPLMGPWSSPALVQPTPYQFGMMGGPPPWAWDPRAAVDAAVRGIRRDEFLDAVTVLPPGEWDRSVRIEPPATLPSQVTTRIVFAAISNASSSTRGSLPCPTTA